MKITLKTLKQQTFVVEVDVEKDTVQTLKEKLYTESDLAYPVDRQRLIYLGKIMDDNEPLSEYKLDDKKFIVVMTKKPKPDDKGDGEASEAKKQETPQTPKQQTDTKPGGDAGTDPTSSSTNKPSTSTPSQSAPSTGDDQKTTDQKKDTNTATSTTTTSSSTSTGGSSSTTETKPTNPSTDTVPEEMQINIQRLKEMGYSEQSARIALEICANIPDRAVEYLLSDMGGASDMSFALAAAQQQQQQQGGGGVPAAGAVPVVGGGGGADASPLDFLRNNPVFENMKRILRDDPTMLPYLMRRMQQSNPDLLTIVAEHQEEFLAMINEGTNVQAPTMSRELEDIASAMINSLTPSDLHAIERLKSLGYPEHLVIQAYIACERDEYDAAMFLVTQTLDDEE